MDTYYKIMIISKEAPWDRTDFLKYNLINLKEIKNKKFLKVKRNFKIIKITFEKIWKNDWKVLFYETLINFS